MRAVAPVMMAAALTAGCGGDDSPCEAYGDALCEAACACSTGGACTVSYDGASLTFENESACKTLYRFGCDQPEEGFDYAGCTAALDDAMCVEADDGRALEHPPCDMGDGDPQ